MGKQKQIRLAAEKAADDLIKAQKAGVKGSALKRLKNIFNNAKFQMNFLKGKVK